MRLYYTTEDYEETCINCCPFGKDCFVGSCKCQNCKYCYGSKDTNRLIGLPSGIHEKSKIQFAQYVKCMYLHKKYRWFYKLLRFFYRVKLYVKYGLG